MDSGDLTGAVLDGRYRVLEHVAEGAMGVVYRAERIKLGRIVAVKVLHESLPDELSSRKRFELEAMAMARLEHPHCAGVIDFGLHEGKPFVVMDFVAGQTLLEILRDGAMPAARALELMRQILSGLAHAHELGIVHRDIKPANLVVSQKSGLGDHVTILDFGLARIAGDGANLTVGIVLGTPSYMAPEQCSGGAIDGRTDVYACGVVLFEMLTGTKPFVSQADDPVEIVRMHLLKPAPRLSEVAPALALGEYEPIVARALAKSPDDRYASASEFAGALDALRARPIAPLVIPSSAPVAAPLVIPSSVPIAAPLVVPASAPVAAPLVIPSSAPVAAPLVVPASAPVAAPLVIAPSAPVAPISDPSSAPVPMVGAASAPVPMVTSASALVGSASAPVALVGPASAPIAEPPVVLPLSRRQLAIRLGLVGGGSFLLILVIAIAGHHGSRHVPIDAAAVAVVAPDAAPAEVVIDPADEAVARATALLTSGKREAALELLNSSRAVFPKNAAMPYLAGRIYFAKLWFPDGLRCFREALRLEPSYRTDPELIKAVLRGFITTPSYDPDIAAFLHDQIGAPAAASLEETARDHPSATIRARAAAELRRY